MTELTLRLQEGDTETTIAVDQNVFTIGRLPECNLYLPFAGVSRNHARISKTAGGVWTIEDLGSKNGTQVNKYLVQSPQELHHGDVVWLGNVSLVVLLTNPVSESTLKPEYAATSETNEQRTILHNVEQLQQQWIAAEGKDGNISNKDKTIARLKDLVDIAKNLCAAASIEEIFSQVQQVVFRYLDSIDRLALLIDVNGCGHLELVNAATRNVSTETIYLPMVLD